ncbi:MAG: hypothetical protein EU547_04930 [Promethearchaeota archaeon]|nr:MAG: hypothetical protein EU547_04930 [Candidatus Lokiarchaeota archaeon]
MLTIEYNYEEVPLQKVDENIKVLDLPDLTKEEKNILDPLVAPTSGLRIELCKAKEEGTHLKLTLDQRRLFLFLRFYKALSVKFKEMHDEQNPNVLIVTDDRPTAGMLLSYCSQIFAYDGYNVIHQEGETNKSLVSSPYGAAAVALYDDIDLVLVLTASHNELEWNGIKFYIDYPMPMSGDMFKEISAIALDLEEIHFKTDFSPQFRNVIQQNNDYIINLLSKIIEIKSIRNKDIIIWPYLGKGRGLVELFENLGANVHIIEETLNPPNPIKTFPEKKLKNKMNETNSDIALLLDADRDRIALYVKQDGKYMYYIPNEIYSAMHNILAKEYNKHILNVRTIPSDLRGDESSLMNILTGVGYKHLGIILYFLLDVEVEQSKIDSAILYLEDEKNKLVQVKQPEPLKQAVRKRIKNKGLEESTIIIVMWEESGGHTLNVLNLSNDSANDVSNFRTDFTLIADKYPVPALVIITELLCRGHIITESIDWSIKGINQTIDANDEEKLKIMENFEAEDGKTITIGSKDYDITALYDNSGQIEIYQLKSSDSTLYFRPSGTSPTVRFYIFGDKDTYLEEMERVKSYVKQNYV